MYFDVLISSLLVALQSAIYCGLCLNKSSQKIMIKVWAAAFFSLLAIAVLTGGIACSQLLIHRELLKDIFWHISMISIGIASTALWNLAAAIMGNNLVIRLVLYCSLIAFGGFYASLFLITDDFVLAIFYYTVVCFFTMIVLLGKFYMNLNKNLLYGICSMLICIVATGLQQMSFALPKFHLTTGGIFFLLLCVALRLFAKSTFYLIRGEHEAKKISTDILLRY